MFSDAEMAFDNVIVIMGLTSVLCLFISVIIHYRTSKYSKSDDADFKAPIDESILGDVKAMGFSIKDDAYNGKTLFAAIADQLVFSDIIKHATAEEVDIQSSLYISTTFKLTERLNRIKEHEDDVILHAIANVYNVTIEIIHVATLESRIIRPRSYIYGRKVPVQNIYIGFIEQSRFISLRKSKEKPHNMDATHDLGIDSTKEKSPVTLRHEDVEGNKTKIEVSDPCNTSIGIGDNTTQYIECGDEYQKHTIITVGKNNCKHIRCKLRAPKEVFECAKHFHENRSEFAGAEIKLRITSNANSDAANDLYEDTIIETLQRRANDFQHEVDLSLDVDIVRVEKECILIVFMSRSQDSALQFPEKFFSKELEVLIRFIFNVPDCDTPFPTELDIHLGMKFLNIDDLLQTTPGYCFATTLRNENALPHPKNIVETPALDKMQFAKPKDKKAFSRGFSIAVQPKKQISKPELRLENLQENVVKAALTSVYKEGILESSTEVEVTLRSIACNCQNNKTLEVRPLSSQKGQTKEKGHRNQPHCFIFEELDFLEVGRMTGIIRGSDGLTATAFRAGHNYVLTTFHFVSATSPNQMEVVFKDGARANKLKLVFSCRELDVALLEIQTPTKTVDSVLYITDASPGDDIYIVGHSSKRNIKKERTTCLNWRSLNVSAEWKDYILFHSEKFGEGSSGAPCFKIHGNKLCVVSIVIGELLGHENKETAHLGVNMMTFYHQLFQQDQNLCQAIFRIVDTETVMCSYCGNDLRYD